MSPISSLSPDQRAVISLVLEKGRGYEQIAKLLRIEEQAVRERAHAALEALAPRDGTPPPPPRREQIADYLLGQQSGEDAEATRTYLETSASGRAWARVVAAELRDVGGDALAPIPDEGGLDTPVVPPPPIPPEAGPEPISAPEEELGVGAPRRPPSSRCGGAFLLGGIVAVAVVVVLVLVLTGGSSSHKRHRTGATSASGATGATGVHILAQINLRPPNGRGHELGVATLIAQGSTRGLALQIQGLRPTTSSFAYALWLYNSHASATRVGFAPAVTSNGRLAVLAPVPGNFSNYRAIILTEETPASARQSTHPGPIVLSGAIPGHTLR